MSNQILDKSRIYSIDKNLHIGTGRDRVCYLLPEDENICVKLSKDSDKQSRREVSYYKYLMSKQTDFSYISRYYGCINTTSGKGECFEVIRDYDNSISKTLRECIREHSLTQEQLAPLLSRLKEYLIENNIVARDLSPSNIMLNKISNDKYQLKIIDGLGNPGINPLTIRISFLTRAARNKSWKSLIKKLDKDFHRASL